jgi:uncharacterized membrane protein YGL010W
MRAKQAQLFSDYNSYHKNSVNKLTHYFGIPFIIFGLLGLLAKIWSVPLAGNLNIDFGLLLIVFVLPFYLWLHLIMGFLFVVAAGVMWYFARETSLTFLWSIFITGWVLQFIGHSIFEKRQPAFLKNMLHVLVGPLWIFTSLFNVKLPK